MGKCLVTKLDSIVDNNNLIKLGEAVATIDSTAGSKLILQTSGCKYYCEKAISINNSTIPANTIRDGSSIDIIKSIDAGSYVFHFMDKYSLAEFVVDSLKEVSVSALNTFNYLNKLSRFSFENVGLYFNLFDLKASKEMLNLSLVCKIVGKLSDLKECKKIENLVLRAQTDLTGDLSDLADKEKLKFLTLAMPLTGDLAIMPSNLNAFYYYEKGYSQIGWTTRDTNKCIISIPSAIKIDNIDKMLQDQANCVVPSNVEVKAINVIGARTSASDAAVATLQQKGYTVSVTPA
jgi:hypothetical protein